MTRTKLAKTILKHEGSIVEINMPDNNTTWHFTDIRKLYPYIRYFIIKRDTGTFKFNLTTDILVVNYDSDYYQVFNKDCSYHHIDIPERYIGLLILNLKRNTVESPITNDITCWPNGL